MSSANAEGVTTQNFELDCTNPVDEYDGGPCLVCPSCQALTEIARLREALTKIREYPKGWGQNPSVCDFIDEVLR